MKLLPEPPCDWSLFKKKNDLCNKEYETDIITLFHATGDFNYRSRWQEGVKTVEEINHFLPSWDAVPLCNGEWTGYYLCQQLLLSS